MGIEVPREEVATMVKTFIEAVANGDYNIMMGMSHTDREYAGCSYFYDMMSEIKRQGPQWANHYWLENAIVPEFHRQASAHNGIEVSARGSALGGFHYYQRISAKESPTLIVQ